MTNLDVVNDAVMPNNAAHSVLFRQRFGSLIPTQDGLINVAIVNGQVYHVWSSSAGDQSAPGTASVSPVQAWLNAAANVNHIIPITDVLSNAVDAHNNWTLLQVVGFDQPQRVRLTALPTPNNGVRPAYETIVLNVKGHINEAYTVFVDAQTGEILYRHNRVNWAAAAFAPDSTTFTGTYVPPASAPCTSPKHSFVVGVGKTRIAVQATAGIAANDISVSLFFGAGPTPLLLQTEDTGTSSEALTYMPATGVPAGTYQVQICQTTNTMGVPQSAPYNYVGTFTTDDSVLPNATLPYPPKWKYNLANPRLDYSSTDVRKLGCWESVVTGQPVPGCERTEKNIAARAPWDYDFRAGSFTATTIGNAAQTAESWGSPLTPSTPYRPMSATRTYSFPWANHWKTSGCDPTILVHTGGVQADADIDASVTQLFVTHNRFHDWSYFLGFTEQNYNLQSDNFGNTPPAQQNDPEVGNVQAGAVSGGANGMYLGRDNANQITLNDGIPGITNQYLFQPIAAALYSPCVDGDMDVGIVGHEYTHAISNRMVGGPDGNLSGAQAGSMGESWSDLDAAEYLFANGFVPSDNVNPENPTAVGIYATQNKLTAIRDYALTPNPLNYSNIGFDTPGPEVHSDGEVWNAANWTVRQNLVDKYNAQFPYTDMTRQKACASGQYAADACPGNRRWVQLMFDAFLLQPGATSMLDARDAMLAADVARFGGANQNEIWRGFAQRGMGQFAYTNGTGDTAPIPNFESATETNEATITFSAKAQDESDAAITSAKIFVGHYEARSRYVADTDPATTVVAATPTTRNNGNVAKFVPGTYDFIVQAPGYGAHRFTRTFAANETANVVFSLPTNRASASKGATVVTTATVAADIAAAPGLIDDTEATGARLGTVAPVAGKSLTVDLAGTSPLMVTSVNVSTAAGPTNAGRFTGVRQFEIFTCSANCAIPTNFTKIYTSPADAFPGDVPRPLQPQLNMRSFNVPATMATHVQLRVVNTQCTGQAKFLGDQDNDPFNNSDCPASASGPIVRATEFQVFTSQPTATVPGVPVAAIELGTTNSGTVQTLVGGCQPDRGLVRLTAAAPAGGQMVQLNSSNTSATVPASITVPAGQTVGYFFTTTTYTPTIVSGAVTASSGGATLSQALNVRPIKVRSVTLTPATVTGAQTVNGTAMLECTAPATVTIDLVSSVPSVATVSASTLTVNSGANMATFTATTTAQNKTRATTINATTGAQTTGAKLTVNP